MGKEHQIASNSNWAKWPTFSFWPKSGWNLENLWICHWSQVPWGPGMVWCPETDGFQWLSQDESSSNPHLCEPFFWGENGLDPHPLDLGLNIWALSTTFFLGWISRTTCHYGVIRIISTRTRLSYLILIIIAGKNGTWLQPPNGVFLGLVNCTWDNSR